MSWIGGSISSLTGQLSNLTKDILTEGTEEISDPATELRLAKEKIQQLDTFLTAQRFENERLKAVGKELEEKAESAELQINSISREYRAVLEQKEKEVNELKRQQHELLEHQAHSASLSLTSSSSTPAVDTSQQGSSSSSHHDHFTSSFNYDGDQGDWDFDDSIRLQRENNKLRSQLQQLESESKHWRSVAGQLGQNDGQNNQDFTAGADVLHLQQRVASLEADLAKKGEELQHQAASLHDHHSHKVSSLKSRHKAEIQELKQQLSSLEQQLMDARDGANSSQHSGSANLPESDRPEDAELQRRLTAALQEKVKAETKLQELEHDGISAEEVLLLRNTVSSLKESLEDAEASRQRLEAELVSVNKDLKSELSQSLQQVKAEQEEVHGDTQAAIQELGSQEMQIRTAGLIDSLQKENTMLTEHKLKLEEQVTLLERAAATASEERQSLQAKVSFLKAKLRNFTSDAEEDSDDSLDTTNLSTGGTQVDLAQTSTSTSALHIDPALVDKEVEMLRAQLHKQSQELAVVEMERADWLMEREALEDVVTDMRMKNQQQQEEIVSLKSGKSGAGGSSEQLDEELASLRDEKEELENALEELDRQHTQALEQLIGQRDRLQAALSQRETEIQQLQDRVKEMDATISQLKESPTTEAADSSARQELEEKCHRLEKQIAQMQVKEEQDGGSHKEQIVELNEKLRKGGLVINDLHMDKRELEEELKAVRQQVEVKVSKLKEMREENAALLKEKKDLEHRLEEMDDRLSEMEEEVEKWQQLSVGGQAQITAQEHARTVEESDEKKEVHRLKSQLEEMEKEREDFKLGFQELTPQVESFQGQEIIDKTLQDILQEEVRVRQQLERDELLITQLQGQIKDLDKEKKVAQRELEELRGGEEKVEEKLDHLQSELESANSLVESLKQEKSKLENVAREQSVAVEDLTKKLSVADSKIFDAGQQIMELSDQLASVSSEKSSLLETIESQEKNVLALMEQVTTLKELEQVQKQAVHAQNDVQKMKNQDEEMATLKWELSNYAREAGTVKAEISRLEKTCLEKDEEISKLKARMSQFDIDLEEIEESVTLAESQHKEELDGKEQELENLRDTASGLHRSLSQVQLQLQAVSSEKEVLERSLSSQALVPQSTTLPADQSVSDQVIQLQVEIERLKEEKREEERLKETISQLEVELALSTETITKLHEDLAGANRTIACHQQGITDLNEKAEEHRRNLSQSEDNVIRHESTIAVLRQSSVDKESQLNELQRKITFLLSIQQPSQLEQLKTFASNNSARPALEYSEPKAIQYLEQSPQGPEGRESEVLQSEHSSTHENGQAIIEEVNNDGEESSRFAEMEKEMEELRGRLHEKDTILAELQHSNKSLLELLEKSSGSDRNLSHQVATHKLESELRSLRGEREQMVAVVSEKSRENSSLKGEVHRLMEVVSASQAALAKLQEDNAKLGQQGPTEEDEDDMRREALANMARLIRDREMEIEALKQKNETLVWVLQDSVESPTAAHLGPLLKDKDDLAQQVAALNSEREQLIACVTQKHSESLAYHAEVQRLRGLLSDAQDAAGKVTTEYEALIPAFEDKTQALLAAQTELIECRQRISDLEVRQGELIQRSHSMEGKEPPALASLEAELEQVRLAETDARAALGLREQRVQTLTHRVSMLEEELATKETECGHLRKQVDSGQFQLTGLMSQLADLRSEREKAEHKTQTQDQDRVHLQQLVNQLTLAVKDKDMEVTSLKEQVATLTSVLQEQQGEQGQVSQLIKEKEVAMATGRQLQQERDQSSMVAEQCKVEASALRSEVTTLKEKEFKLMRELERLRGHLIQIEEGYTKEALESEEREKELRTRLAVAEERLLSSSSEIELASQESTRQVETLQLQLQQVSSQRDAAYQQVAATQEQCYQSAASLANLQRVLEHFQKEKDSAIAMETERYQNQTKVLMKQVEELKAELEATRGDLTEALDGLEAASRLSEQLDRKEDALLALKEEVQLREQALSAAEEEIRKLNSSTEAKVDKTLMHNMVMTWLMSPANKRHEIVNLIGHVLSFSAEDFEKIEAAENSGGLLTSLFRRSAPASSTPAKPSTANQSFSQLFVKFLEKESSPPPSPVRLPAEAMAAEAQHRHKPTFNPFTAPRHVTHDGQRSATPSSHILMSHENPAPTPLFAPLTSVSNAGESAILKDVLGKR